MDNVFQTAPLRLWPFQLLLGRHPNHEHDSWKYITWKAEQLPVKLTLLHNVSDVAGAQPKAIRGGYRVLSGNRAVRHREHQISRPWGTRFTAAGGKCVIPLLAVCAENQYDLRLCDEWLVVAGDGQFILDALICNIQNGVELLVAGSGRRTGGFQDHFLFPR